MRSMVSFNLMLACVQGSLAIGSTLKLESKQVSRQDYDATYRYIDLEGKKHKHLKDKIESLEFKFSKPIFKAEQTSNSIEVITNLNAINQKQLVSLSLSSESTADNQNFTDSLLSLAESIPCSGIYDTVLLPAEDVDTLYLINFCAQTGIDTVGEIELLFNGQLLPYLAMDSALPEEEESGFSRTLMIMNPAHTSGQLSLYALNPFSTSKLPQDVDFTGCLNVIKLENTP